METLGGGPAADDLARYLIEVMVLAVSADGAVEDAEIDELQGRIRRLPRLGRLSDDQVDAWIRQGAEAIELEGFGTRLEKIAAAITLPGERAEMIRAAAWIVTADGKLAPEEVDVIQRMQQVFGISNEELERLLDHELGA